MFTEKSIKQFLKPNWGKVLILIFFLSISFYFSKDHYSPNCYFNSQTSIWQQPCVTGGLDVYYYGFPLESISKNCPGSCANPSWAHWGIDNNLYFIIDLLFWYLISCFLILVR